MVNGLVTESIVYSQMAISVVVLVARLKCDWRVPGLFFEQQSMKVVMINV